uniref:Uncharacterized protein n=1 Tax=Oryza barthii TaxID=65489 RepID=A0A0D3GNP6_9ORYZ
MYCKPGMAIRRSHTTNRSGMAASNACTVAGVELSGAFEGCLLEDFPGCPREMQRGLAAMLINPGECNLETIHSGPGLPWLPEGDAEGLGAMLIAPGECNLETIHDGPRFSSSVAGSSPPSRGAFEGHILKDIPSFKRETQRGLAAMLTISGE